MPFVKSLNSAFKIVKLNSNVITEVASDEKALMDGIVIIIIAGFLNGIRTLDFPSVVVSPISLLIGAFIGYGIIHLVALAFKGQGSFMQLFRAGSHSMIINWLSILYGISFLGNLLSFVISIWSLVIGVIIVENVYKLPRGKAIMVVLIPIIIFFVISVLILSNYVLGPNFNFV